MKLTILKDVMKKGIEVVEKITQKNLTLPILQTTIFQTEKNFLTLSSTNLETGVIWWGLARIEKEGKICLPTKVLSQLISFVPQKSISLFKENLSLWVECENYKTEIIGLDAEEFPIIPKIQTENSILVDTSLFCQSLSQVVKIPSPSTARPEISGVLLNFQENIIKIAATDSFRLAEKKLFLPNPFPQKHSLILPQNSVREIIGIFGELEGEMRIYISPKQIWFESLMSEISHPQIQYTSRLIEGEYPNYEEITPKKFGTTVSLSKEKLLNQIKTASLFSGKNNEIIMKIDPKNETITILSQSPNLGKYEGSLAGKIKGEKVEIAFNHRFLIDGILEIKSPELTLNLTNEEGPAVLRPVDLEDYFYILMPIKTI